MSEGIFVGLAMGIWILLSWYFVEAHKHGSEDAIVGALFYISVVIMGLLHKLLKCQDSL